MLHWMTGGSNLMGRLLRYWQNNELVALLYTTHDAQEGDELTWTYFRSTEQEALYRRES
jgi:hypothetical protein